MNNNKRPYLKHAIDSIRELFYKNRSNRIVLRNIMHELMFRKTDKAKILTRVVESQINRTFGVKSNALKDIEAELRSVKTKKDLLSNESKAQINTNINKDKSLEELLKSLSLKEFVQSNPVPVRVKNSILSEDDDFLKFDSVYSFILASKKDKKRLKRLDFFGEKSLNDLTNAITDYIKKLGKGDLDYSTPLAPVVDLSIPVNNEIVANLSDEQIHALKNIPLNFFVSTCDLINVRTRNAILRADGLYEYQNLYDFYASPSKYKENLLCLKDFGKLSLDNLINSVEFIIEKEGGLAHLSNTVTQTNNISIYETISEFIDYSIISILNDRERLIIKERYLNKNTLTLQEAGDKSNVSRERIRQIESKAIKKIQGFSLSSSTKESLINFQTEFENYFFKNCNFISVKRAEYITKKMQKTVVFYIKAFNNTLSELLNESFFYSVKFQGWFVSESILIETENNFILKQTSFDLDSAVHKAQWPITIPNLSNSMGLPECVIADMVASSSKFNIEKLSNETFIRLTKITVKEAVRYVLRRYKRGMTLEEARKNCSEMFNLDLTLGALGNALGDLPDGLIVDTGTYALYENLNINESQIDAIRDACKKYLLKEQKYISAFVIFNNLKKQNNFYEKYGALDNGHMLFGICQDDHDFITKRGFMLGLNCNDFKGRFVSLTQEIIDLMLEEERALSVNEIMEKLSQTRCLIWSSLFGMLDNDKNNIFERIGGNFSLVGDQVHLEINDEDLFEVDIDDI